jgi:ATP-dependent DNA helicase DinG
MDYLETVFGNGGIFAREFKGYERRDGQVRLALAVDAAARTGRSAIVEAPTGTGKSVGYLVPLFHHLVDGADALIAARPEPDGADGFDEEGEEEIQPPRALVVTANIALQEQLIAKDIPTLQRLLPWQISAAIAKGRGNYLCLDRFDDSAATLLLEPLRDPEERAQWNHVAAWAKETARGDLSELPFELTPALRQRLAVTSDDCLGKPCPRFADCHAERARNAVKRADLIVTNYHLLFAHLAFAAETGVGVLPRFDLVVLDEAHEAADIARDFFGFRMTEGSIRYATRLLSGAKAAKGKPELAPIDEELKEQARAAAERVFEELRELRRSRDYYARITKPDAGPSWRALHSALLGTVRAYTEAAERPEVGGARASELRRAARRAMLTATNLQAAMTCEDEGVVFFIEDDEAKRRTTLCGKLIHVGEALRARLFESKQIRAVVATSATLRTDTGEDGFGFVAHELGADGADEVATESPFDFGEQALLVVPDGLPDPGDKDFADRIAELVAQVVELAGGRTLGLFTSFRGLNAAASRLRAEHGSRYAILRQGDAPRTQLVERFRKDVSSVLLGVKSFWAGVDVPGEALSVVVIDRVPFDPPDDPILDALSEQSRRTFKEYSIPRATIELRQGFGRLIRAKGDRGVVVLLDRRLRAKPWGKTILRALPPAMLSTRLEDIRGFLAGERNLGVEAARQAARETRASARQARLDLGAR